MSYPQYPTPSAPQQLVTGPPPVQVSVPSPESQNRLTILVRLILLIPQFFVLFFIGIAAVVVVFLGWWGALFTGRLPDFAADFLTGYIRWSSRVFAYGILLTGKYPPFTLDDVSDYPVHVATTRERLNRWAVFFRFILAIPVNIMVSILTYGAFTIVAVVAWLIALFMGRLPESLHLAYAAVFRFQIRTQCYYFLLTPTYPGGIFGDQGQPPPPPLPGHGTAPGGYAAAPGGSGAAPGGYGYGQGGEPQQDTPPPYGGYAAPAGYAAPTGYGAPAGGYGAPGSYDVPEAPGWRLNLTSGAKGLVIFFIVLGALLYIGGNVAQNVYINHNNNGNVSVYGS